MSTNTRQRATTREVIEHVRQALSDLKYGEVRVVVQDGVVVQVERTVKTRLSQEKRDLQP